MRAPRCDDDDDDVLWRTANRYKCRPTAASADAHTQTDTDTRTFTDTDTVSRLLNLDHCADAQLDGKDASQ